MNFTDRQEGSSLIELLTALALLAMVFAPVLTLFNTGYSAIINAGRQTAAVNLCRDRLEELCALGYDAVYDQHLAGGSAPQVEENLSNMPLYSRTTTITILNDYLPGDYDPVPKLLQICVTVTWTTTGRESAETLTCYLSGR